MSGVKNLVPPLPAGMRVSEKPADIEFLRRSKSKWMPIIDTLKVIDTTKCVEIDITGATKGRINTIRQGIKTTAKQLKFNHLIKFAVKNNTLFVWTNK